MTAGDMSLCQVTACAAAALSRIIIIIIIILFIINVCMLHVPVQAACPFILVLFIRYCDLDVCAHFLACQWYLFKILCVHLSCRNSKTTIKESTVSYHSSFTVITSVRPLMPAEGL